ncbi:MAG: tetratricopeptide repeat protein [Ardenticatenia bacterium]|nr:tetratricopeptide repeat protein [Ardenticatenia bacterium]
METLTRSPHHVVRLSPLPQDQSETLVATLLREHVPPEVVYLVVNHAQGNPFFVEEMLRALIEEGTLRREGEGWVLSRPIEEVSVPTSVQDLLAARLDRLPSMEKRTLYHAAIIGRTFWQNLLTLSLRETEVPEDRVPHILNSVERHQLVVRHGHAPIGEDWEWSFRHVLIQEVAYRSVRKQMRRRVHRLVAQQLESRLSKHTEFLIPLIAYHYERDDAPDKAVEYLQRAAEQAAAQFANEDAVRYLTRALMLLDSTTWPAEKKQAAKYNLLMAREGLYHLVGRRDDQERDLCELEALAATLGDFRRLAEVALRRAAYAEAISNYPAAVRAAQEAARLAEEAGTTGLHIEALITWGRVLWQQGEMEEARQLLDEALMRSRQHQYWQGEVASLHYLGTVFYLLGNLHEARARLEEALAIRRHMDDRRGMAMSLNNLVAVYYGMGDYARAREYSEEALHVLRMMGDRLGEAKVMNNLGAIYHILGDLDRALELHRQALTMFRRVGSRYGEALSLGNLAVIFYDRGDYEEAREYAARALAEQRALESKSGEADEKTHLALAEEALGALDEAARLYDEARALREEMGQTALAMEDVAGLARIAWQQGNRDEALELAHHIAQWIDTHGVEGAEHPFRLYLTVIDIFMQAGHCDQARRLAEEAVGRLEAQAQRISDPEVRRTFLDDVPLHRTIRERAETLFGGGGPA